MTSMNTVHDNTDNTAGNTTGKDIAVIQMHSGSDLRANLDQAASLIEQAADRGASLAVLPEAFAFLGDGETDQLSVVENPGEGPVQNFLAETAARHGIWLVGGSVPIRSGSNGNKAHAACILFDDQGRMVAQYNKIHLFDVLVEDTGERYGESAVFEPGAQCVVVDTPCGRIGLTICYDLRFPELFRLLMDQGAECIVVPSAFTASTGADHWHTLLRSRAIENTVFIAAANQGNQGRESRDCYGHSLIIDPWGKVLSELDDAPGVATATLNFSDMERIRRDFPCLKHRRFNVQAPTKHDKRAERAERAAVKTRVSA